MVNDTYIKALLVTTNNKLTKRGFPVRYSLRLSYSDTAYDLYAFRRDKRYQLVAQMLNESQVEAFLKIMLETAELF